MSRTEYHREWRKKNKDKVKANKQKYEQGNEKVKQYHQDYNKKYYHAKKEAWIEFLERQFKDEFGVDWIPHKKYEKDERLFIDRLRIEFNALYSYGG